jgi:hypothetical protein
MSLPYDLAQWKFRGRGTQQETLIHNLTEKQRNGQNISALNNSFSEPMSIENEILRRIEVGHQLCRPMSSVPP